MPKYINEEIGKVIRRRKVKTFGDQVKEFLERLAGVAVVVVILSLIFG